MRRTRTETRTAEPVEQVRTRGMAFIGHVDSLRDGKVGGWVFDADDPSRELDIEVLAGDRVIGQARTSIPRPDVAVLHDVKAPPGFLVPVDLRLLASQPADLRVVVKGTGVALAPVPGLTGGVMRVELAPESRDGLRNTENVLDCLRGNRTALIALNHHPEIRAKVDPALGDVYIINGARGTASELFRCYAAAASIQRLGYAPLVFDVGDVARLPTRNLRACVFVRVAHTREVAEFIGRLRKAGVPVLADFDDLVFRPSLMHKIDGVRFLSDAERTHYAQGMTGYRAMLEACDVATLTTSFLAEQAASCAKDALVVPNFPLAKAVAAAARVAPRDPRSPEFVIGYYSGTMTHQADFAECAPAIATLMRKHANVRLRVVGHLDMREYPEFAQVASQFEARELLAYDAMIADIASCNIVIAPLQVGNEFCEAKSELKFFDAALVRTPVVASATGPFRGVIDHGRNGFLATTARDWYQALETAYIDRGLLARCGAEARATVQERFSPSRQDAAYASALARAKVRGAAEWASAAPPRASGSDTPVRRSRKRAKLAMLLPDLLIGSGGHRKALAICREHVAMGGEAEVCVISERSDGELQSMVSAHFMRDCGTVRAYRGIAPEADVAVATSWPTAYEVAKWSDVRERFYFVQDFEPLFNPMSTGYARALHSYRLGLKPICLGRWNQEKLAAELALESQVLDFPVDRETYFPRPLERRPEVLFYARPSQPRRLYELGIEAIALALPHMPDWQFTLFGEELEAPAGTTSLGRIDDQNELARLYSQARIGMAFSATNPSLIPFEMLACGLPVVDVELGGAARDFAGCASLLRAEPTPEALARVLVRTAADAGKLSRLSAQAVRWCERLPSEREFARNALRALAVVKA